MMPAGSEYSARRAAVSSSSSDWTGRRPFQRRKVDSSKVEFRASWSMSIPTYSRTPLTPSMKDMLDSAAMVFARPLSKCFSATSALMIWDPVGSIGCCEIKGQETQVPFDTKCDLPEPCHRPEWLGHDFVGEWMTGIRTDQFRHHGPLEQDMDLSIMCQ